ncbi:MAG: fused MFS/spermidine synthase [Anaerolineae bacterium]
MHKGEETLLREKLWKPNWIVFISSACIMIIELVASRMIAPYLGVSLYTWTSVIGVVLAGISLGNYLGGKIADRFASRRALGFIFLGAGLVSLSILVLNEPACSLSWPGFLPYMARVLLATAAIFFLPSCFLGMISPLIVKLTLKDLERTGDTVGKIYAYSALGSIVGTFATGFFLISWFGSQANVWFVSLVLILMGLLFGDWGGWRGIALVVPFSLGLTLAPHFLGLMKSPCLAETNYFCIDIFDEALEDDGKLKVLVLDHLIHSYVNVEDPTHLVYEYEKVYASVTDYISQNRSPLKALFIGGGGYTMPRYLEKIHPGSLIEVVEIDPEVTRLAYEELGLPPDTTIRTYNEDARIFLNDLRQVRGEYDLVYGDAFNGYAVPYHLTTLEFNEIVKRILKEDGFYLANVIDRYTKGHFLRAYLHTLEQTFPYVYVVPATNCWEGGCRSTFVFIAGAQPLDSAALQQSITDPARAWILEMLWSEEQKERFLAAGRAVLLTDDYAPVDNLIAPILTD